MAAIRRRSRGIVVLLGLYVRTYIFKQKVKWFSQRSLDYSLGKDLNMRWFWGSIRLLLSFMPSISLNLQLIFLKLLPLTPLDFSSQHDVVQMCNTSMQLYWHGMS